MYQDRNPQMAIAFFLCNQYIIRAIIWVSFNCFLSYISWYIKGIINVTLYVCPNNSILARKMFDRNKGHVLQAVVSWATYILIYFSSSAPWRFICLVFTLLFFLGSREDVSREREREREKGATHIEKTRVKLKMEYVVQRMGKNIYGDICYLSSLNKKKVWFV